MARKVRCGLIQAANVLGPEAGLPAIKKAMIDKRQPIFLSTASTGVRRFHPVA